MTGLGLLLAAENPAQASCKTPLPSTELRDLDASADVDPGKAIAGALAKLSTAGTADGLRKAELYAIIADAYDTLNNDIEAIAAVAAGRRSLASLPPGPAVQGLDLRLALVAADASEGAGELTDAVRSLNDWEPRVVPKSLSHACLLLVRSRVQGRLTQHELAAKDGLLAYRTAVESGSGDAISEAAYQLSMTFRRAGLFDDARRMADEVIAYARKQDQTAALASALWERAVILGEMGEAEAALSTLAESRQLTVLLKDDIGLAFSDHERCNDLLALQRIDEAEAACQDAERGFRATGRADQAAASQDQLARIDLIRGHPQRAVVRLQEALKDGGKGIPPMFLPALYRDLSDALSRTGHPVEALAALQKHSHLVERADQRQRSLGVAVLNARQKAELQDRESQALSRQIVVEREQAASRELSRRLAIGLAAAAVLLSLLIGYLLVASRRYARELRRRETILRQTSENAPDALVLLDASGRTRFANRSLFGVGEAPSVDQPLADCVPPEVRLPMAGAVTDLIEHRRSVSFDVSLPSGDRTRDFELRGVPIVEDGHLLGATLRASDVTELRTMERRVLDAANRERQILSSDLHEGLGQELTGVALLLRTAVTAAQRGRSDVLELMTEAMAQVDRAIAATRDLARGFSPVQIERGSLSVALDRLAHDAERRLRIRVTSSSQPPDIRAPDLVADHLYRIAYEAVTNAARHSGGREVAIDLRQEAGALRLTVTDDGAGFADTGRSSDGLGTRMMAYRARLVGGTLRYERVQGGGTRVVTVVPVEGDG
jgi:PAS domain S-box-containing protein